MTEKTAAHFFSRSRTDPPEATFLCGNDGYCGFLRDHESIDDPEAVNDSSQAAITFIEHSYKIPAARAKSSISFAVFTMASSTMSPLYITAATPFFFPSSIA